MRTRSVETIGLLVGATLLCFGANGAGSLSQERQDAKVVHAEITAAQFRLATGEEMYGSLCAACHGDHGRGGGRAAVALAISPTDLTRLAANNDGDFPGIRTLNVILGDRDIATHRSREMPVYSRLLRVTTESPAMARHRAWGLVRYVESIQVEGPE